MNREIFYFTVHLEEGVIGRAWLNDLPVHKVMTQGPDSMTGGANFLLVPGRNELVLEILRLPAPRPIPPAGMKVYRVKDPNTQPIVAEVLAGVEIPAGISLKSSLNAPVIGPRPRAMTQRPWDEIELPFSYRVEFEMPADLPEPPYYRAPRAEFPCEGTPELLLAVREVQEALEQKDLRRFLDLLSLKHEWWAAAFTGHPYAAMDRQREGATEFFALDYRVRPLDEKRLHFEPRAGGRVAYVCAWDDGPAIEAVGPPPAAEDLPGLALRTNLLLTQHNGRWRVFA
jgi:hypothetical protein